MNNTERKNDKMNPQSAALPSAPKMVNDVAGPVPQPATDSISASANIVSNIPVHAPAAPASPASEDDELDKIMHDVGRELKSEDKKPDKHHLFGFGRKAKKEPPFTATAVRQPPSASQAPTPVQSAAVAPAQAVPAAAAVAVRPEVAPAAVQKDKVRRSVPVFVIFVSFLVAGFLIVAAIAAYRQS